MRIRSKKSREKEYATRNMKRKANAIKARIKRRDEFNKLVSWPPPEKLT